jgi:hypothetical protein
MSTPTSETGFPPDPTIDPEGSPNRIGPKLPIPHLGIQPTTHRPWWFILGIVLGQAGIFIALMGPAIVSIASRPRSPPTRSPPGRSRPSSSTHSVGASPIAPRVGTVAGDHGSSWAPSA